MPASHNPVNHFYLPDSAIDDESGVRCGLKRAQGDKIDGECMIMKLVVDSTPYYVRRTMPDEKSSCDPHEHWLWAQPDTSWSSGSR